MGIAQKKKKAQHQHKMISKFKHFNKFTSRHHTRLFLFSKQQQRFQSNNSDSIEKQLAQLGIESHSGSKVEKKDDESKKPILNQRALKSTRKTKWLFNKDGKRNHFEDGTTIQGYKPKFDIELIETGQEPPLVDLVYGFHSDEHLLKAQSIFKPSNVEYYDSFATDDDVISVENSLPEVAIIGKSNCGKSSLLNRLLGSVVALVSQTPGRTRTINRFNVDNKFMLMDVPGYGFAQAPGKWRSKWGRMERSLMEQRELSAVLLLIDSKRGIDKLDQERMEWLEEAGVQYQFVLTKCDKINESALRAQIQSIQKKIRKGKTIAYPCVIATSSRVGDYGVDELRCNILEMIGYNFEELDSGLIIN